jgi:SOS-response transcriptional repressor LexA
MAAGENSALYDDLMRFKPDGLTPNAWAMKAGVSRTVWADMRRHGNPSRRTLEKLLSAANSSLAEFEALRIAGSGAPPALSPSGVGDRRAGWGAAQLLPLSLLATATAGEWKNPADRIELTELQVGQLVDRVARPASLANDLSAYAITIVGNSMWPRFRPGRRVVVSANAPIAIGDDVVVRLKSEAGSATVHVLIKELVRRGTTGVDLRQFNPDVTFSIAASDIGSIEKVMGELI